MEYINGVIRRCGVLSAATHRISLRTGSTTMPAYPVVHRCSLPSRTESHFEICPPVRGREIERIDIATPNPWFSFWRTQLHPLGRLSLLLLTSHSDRSTSSNIEIDIRQHLRSQQNRARELLRQKNDEFFCARMYVRRSLELSSQCARPWEKCDQVSRDSCAATFRPQRHSFCYFAWSTVSACALDVA